MTSRHRRIYVGAFAIAGLSFAGPVKADVDVEQEALNAVIQNILETFAIRSSSGVCIGGGACCASQARIRNLTTRMRLPQRAWPIRSRPPLVTRFSAGWAPQASRPVCAALHRRPITGRRTGRRIGVAARSDLLFRDRIIAFAWPACFRGAAGSLIQKSSYRSNAPAKSAA